MVEEMLKQIAIKHEAMNSGKSEDLAAKDMEEAVDKPPPDCWVRRGEYIVRRHTTPRTTLFSPTQWLHESGSKSIFIPDFKQDEHGVLGDVYTLEELEVSRETKPDSRYLGQHWDTWSADAREDIKMPKA